MAWLGMVLPSLFSSANALPAEMAFLRIALVSISAFGGSRGKSLKGSSGKNTIVILPL